MSVSTCSGERIVSYIGKKIIIMYKPSSSPSPAIGRIDELRSEATLEIEINGSNGNLVLRV